MSNWRALADEALNKADGQNTRNTRNDSSETGPSVPTVPSVPPLDPVRALRAWKQGLATADACKPPDGWSTSRWQTLYDDAAWLMAKFGENAARDGWSTADLFGLWPDKPGWGGVADRIRGSRSLLLTAERACWRRFGVIEQMNRGAYPDLRPFWQAGA